MTTEREEARESRARALGSFIRAQRELTNLSLRATAAKAGISNPYLSQLERGLHEPSVRVLTALARTLRIPSTTLLEQAGFGDDPEGSEGAATPDTEQTILRDPHLTPEQRQALLGVYRSYRDANQPAEEAD
jgi:transcriptional regulator with XRE-family HTH domain